MKKYLLILFCFFPIMDLEAQHVLIKKPTKTQTSSLIKAETNTSKKVQHSPKQSIEPEMVYIAGGSFEMGSNDYFSTDSRPAHRVRLSDYYIGKYEVTQAQWKAVMGKNPSDFKYCDTCPVDYVSWDDTQKFLQKLNTQTGKSYRLPTEAEWEYAVRGGSKSNGYTYSGSNNIESVSWYKDNSGGKTHPVGQKQANELGIYDMSGNVREWCSDWYGAYSSIGISNPSGASSGTFRVLRGGSWDDSYISSDVYYRSNSYSDFRNSRFGFRLVLGIV